MLHKSNEDQKGFHLLDALIAIAVTAILAASAIPAMSAIHRRIAVKDEARLLRARLEGLWLRAAGGEGRIFVSLRPRGYVARLGSAGGRQIDTYLLRPGTRIETTLRDPLVFGADGIASPVTIAVTGTNGRCEIVISLRGRIRTSC